MKQIYLLNEAKIVNENNQVPSTTQPHGRLRELVLLRIVPRAGAAPSLYKWVIQA